MRYQVYASKLFVDEVGVDVGLSRTTYSDAVEIVRGIYETLLLLGFKFVECPEGEYTVAMEKRDDFVVIRIRKV